MTSPPVQRLNILVIDDEEIVLAALCRFLELDGHRVESAAEGKEALVLFRSGRFDLVITDLDLPGIQGDELATAIKAIAPAQPVLMITAEADRIQADQDRLKNIDCLLGKPFMIEDLRAAIASAVSTKHHPPAPPRPRA